MLANAVKDLGKRIGTYRTVTILSFILILFVILTKNRFDYLEYGRQWLFFLEGGNPWGYDSNTYGPLHALMAYFYALDIKIPRLIFSLAALLSAFYLWGKVRANSRLNEKHTKWLKYLLLYNPIIWIFFVVNGCNDGLVGMLILLGLVKYDDKNFVLSALFLSLAVLYKYIPLFILPFLAVPNQKINWRFSISSFAFLATGFGLTWAVWGDRFLSALFFNSGRESKILSIFRYLRGEYSFLKPFGIENLDHWSTYLVIASVLIIFILHIAYNLNYYESLLLSMLSVLFFYKVGHFQFYIVLYFLLVYYMSRQESGVLPARLVKYIFYFLFWLAFATVLYGVTEGFYRHFNFLRDIVGLPHSVFLLLVIIALVRYISDSRPKKQENYLFK